MEPYIIKDLTYYNNVFIKNSIKIPKWIINYYDLTFVLKGSLTYIVDGVKYILNESDAIIIKPGMARERMAGSEPVNYISFNFQVLDDKLMPEQVYLKKATTGEIKNILSAFPMKHLNQTYRTKEKTVNILNYILHEIHNTIELESHNIHIIKIKKYINSHLSCRISLNDVSEYMHLSKEYTAYIFKKETNKTVTEYINEKKLLLAKEMLQAEEMNLNNIAESLGYENYSYFSRIFKKKFGFSPNKFKK